MKTIALSSFALCAVLATGCAASTPADGTEASEDAMEVNTYGDITPGAREATRLLSATPLSSMTIASSQYVSAWRFDMSATGFVVTAIDDRGRDNTKIAYAIDTSGTEPKLSGLAIDDPYARSADVRKTMLQIKADLDAARANVPEMEDPGMPDDPSAWKPTAAKHCSKSTDMLITGAMNVGALLALGGTWLMVSVGGSVVGVIAGGAGAIILFGADAAGALVCNEKSEFWSTAQDHAGQ